MIRTTIEDQARLIARRKEELGIEGRDYVAPNSGARRTETKRELLRTIEREAQAQGAAPRFQGQV